MSTLRKTLGKNIKSLREIKGWTQSTLAGKLGISPTFMMHIERGTRGVSIETLGLLTEVLGVPVSSLFATEEEIECAESAVSPALKHERDLRDDIDRAITRYIGRMKEIE